MHNLSHQLHNQIWLDSNIPESEEKGVVLLIKCLKIKEMA